MREWIALRRQLRETATALIDLVLPATCPGCGEPSPGLCRPCRHGLHARARPWCARCGEPLAAVADACPEDHRSLQGLAWARAPFSFAGTGGALVRRFKLDGNAAAGQRLAAAMALALADAIHGDWRHAVLVPVPLHWRRRRERGFDQAALLAGMVAARTRLDAEAGVLVRRRATLPQGDPRVTSRTNNVDGVFDLARARRVKGRFVILVDDVCTSGATARACARMLRSGGAAAVALLTACRA